MTHNQGHSEPMYPQTDPFRTEGMQVNIDDLERELFSGSILSQIGYDSPMNSNRMSMSSIEDHSRIIMQCPVVSNPAYGPNKRLSLTPRPVSNGIMRGDQTARLQHILDTPDHEGISKLEETSIDMLHLQTFEMDPPFPLRERRLTFIPPPPPITPPMETKIEPIERHYSPTSSASLLSQALSPQLNSSVGIPMLGLKNHPDGGFPCSPSEAASMGLSMPGPKHHPDTGLPFGPHETASLIFSAYLYKKNRHGRFQRRLFRCDGVSLMCFSPGTIKLPPGRSVLQIDSKRLLRHGPEQLTKDLKKALVKCYLTDGAISRITLNPMLAKMEDSKNGSPDLKATGVYTPKWVIPISGIKQVVRADPGNSDPLIFSISNDKREYTVRAPNAEWLERWMSLLHRIGKIVAVEGPKRHTSFVRPDTLASASVDSFGDPMSNDSLGSSTLSGRYSSAFSTATRLRPLQGAFNDYSKSQNRRQKFIAGWKECLSDLVQDDLSLINHIVSIRMGTRGGSGSFDRSDDREMSNVPTLMTPPAGRSLKPSEIQAQQEYPMQPQYHSFLILQQQQQQQHQQQLQNLQLQQQQQQGCSMSGLMNRQQIYSTEYAEQKYDEAADHFDQQAPTASQTVPSFATQAVTPPLSPMKDPPSPEFNCRIDLIQTPSIPRHVAPEMTLDTWELERRREEYVADDSINVDDIDAIANLMQISDVDGPDNVERGLIGRRLSSRLSLSFGPVSELPIPEESKNEPIIEGEQESYPMYSVRDQLHYLYNSMQNDLNLLVKTPGASLDFSVSSFYMTFTSSVPSTLQSITHVMETAIQDLMILDDPQDNYRIGMMESKLSTLVSLIRKYSVQVKAFQNLVSKISLTYGQDALSNVPPMEIEASRMAFLKLDSGIRMVVFSSLSVYV